MNSEVKLFLLKIVKFNGNLTPLLKRGYEYSQIFQLLDELIAEGLLEKNNNRIAITDIGLREIDKLNKHLERRDSSSWIEPESASRISKINKNDVFLPAQDELSF